MKSREELEEVTNMVKERFGPDSSYVISEYIKDVHVTLDCGFYLTKSGRVIYLGVQECILEDFGYVAGTIDSDKQEKYKERLYDKFVVPVASYLHKKGYFGVVGIDIVANSSGDYLVDLNPRINGDTSYLMLAQTMATLGFTKSLFFICATVDGVTGKQLVEKANSINEKNANGRIVIMATADDGKKCHASFSVFSDSMGGVKCLNAELWDNELYNGK